MESKTPTRWASGRLSITRIAWIETAMAASVIVSGLVYLYFPMQFEGFLQASFSEGTGEISSYLNAFRISTAWFSVLVFVGLTAVAWISSFFLFQSRVDERETLEVLGAGRFLLNDRLEILEANVPVLSGVLPQPDLFRGSFIHFLKTFFGEEVYVPAELFLLRLLDPNIPVADLSDSHTLKSVALNTHTPVGEETRIFRFDFTREVRANRIRSIRGTIRDISEVTRLAKALEQAEDKAHQQYQLLTAIAQIEPSLLEDFFRGSLRELETIQKTLSSNIGTANFQEKLYTIYRALHTIKGNASLMRLDLIREQAHAFEECINEVKSRKAFDAQAFHSLNMPLEDLQASLSLLRNLREFLASTSEKNGENEPQTDRVLMSSIESFILRLAKELDKEVRFDHKDFDKTPVPEKYRRVFKDVLIQLIRNSVRHGIEPSEEREKLGKPTQGNLLLEPFENGPGLFSFVFRDDGRGLEAERLRETALASGQWSKEAIDGWDEQTLFAVIFEPGFSTVRKASMDAGWGVGMDIVKKRIEQYGGEVQIFSEPRSYCEFRITLPV